MFNEYQPSDTMLNFVYLLDFMGQGPILQFVVAM